MRPAAARLALLAALALARAAVAQTAPGTPPPAGAASAELAAGDRLRAWPRAGRPVVGAFLLADSARLTLRLADDSQYAVGWGQLDSLHVQRGWSGGRGGRGALTGALAGGAALALVFLGATGEGDVIDPGPAAGMGFVAGAALGGFVGGLVGTTRARERWVAVPLAPRRP